MTDFLLEIVIFLLKFIESYWWVFVPFFLFFVFLDIWLFYKREHYKKSIKWTLLEVRLPKEVEKTPKAMEQIFAAMHATYSFGILPRDKWLRGKVENWMSFEIAGRAGAVYFFIRVPEDYRNLLESAIYAQYPDAEITLVPEEDDYVNQFPAVLPDDTYDVWGTDFVLARNNAYPIRTYEYFEHPVREEKRIDPIASITEVMSKLESSEAIWLQLLIRPTGDKWVEKAKEVVDELLGQKKKPEYALSWIEKGVRELVIFIFNFFKAFFEHPQWEEEEKKEEKEVKKEISPGQRKVIEAIENKMSKIGFEAALRFVYIDRKDSFTRKNISGVMGALRQFNTYDMNALKPNLKTMPLARAPFRKMKILHKKRMLYTSYRLREFPKEFSVLNTEELATLYHFPIGGVKSPMLRRVAVKKGGLPSDLPIIE